MVTKEALINKLREMHSFSNIYSGYTKIKFHLTKREYFVDEERFVDEEWNNLLAQGKVKYSSQIVALNPNATHLENDTLYIEAYPSDFKHWRTTIDYQDKPKTWLTGPSGVMEIKKGREKWYIFGIRNLDTFQVGGNLETIPSGFLDVKYLSVNNPFAEALYHELEEEVGVLRSHVVSLKPMRMGSVGIDNRTNKPFYCVCTDFIIGLNSLSPEQIEEQFAMEKREHEGIEIVQHQKLVPFIDENKEFMSARTLFTLEHLLRII